MHHAWLWLLHISGSDDVSGKWYGFWSGFAGDITLLFAVLTAPYVQWKRTNCQVKRCWRFGRHPFKDPDDNTIRHLCWKHHPEVGQKQLTAQHLRERHHLYFGDKPGRG